MASSRRHQRARALLASLLLPAALGLAPAAADEEPAKPEELLVAFNLLDVELDPHHSIYSSEAQIFTATYEGLFSYNPNSLEPVRAACKTYNRSPDGKTYTFYIRDEAAWSDGRPLVARDFRDAWLRALAPDQKADYAAFFDAIAGAKDFRLGRNPDPASVGIAAIADKVLQVSLVTKADYFTRLLCHHSFSPIHPDRLAVKDWRKAGPPPVNGPYRFASIGKEGILLVKNERYWDAASVAVPRIRALFTDEDDAITRRFDDGEVHWLAGPMNIKALLDNGSIQFNPMFGTHYWFFACDAKPWSDPDLRRALALLLPWPEIRSRDLYAFPASTLVLPYEGYRAAKGFAAADPAEAKRLLEKAGFPEGKGLPPLVVLAPDGEDAKRVTGIMKAAWEKLPGFSVELRVVPAARYFESVRKGPGRGEYGLALTTWIGDFADPLAFLQMWISDSNLNDAGLADGEYDRLIAASAAKDGADRLAALGEAESRLLGGAAVLPIYHSVAVNVVDTDFVQGWYANALDIHPFKYLSFGQRKVRPNVAAVPGGIVGRAGFVEPAGIVGPAGSTALALGPATPSGR
jgi:oligopeptide transport system substrate-binding protein